MESVVCLWFKQRAVIEFFVHENESVMNIHKRLCAVYGSCAVARSTVGRRAKRVKASGCAVTEVRDLPRAGRPPKANTPDMLNRADAIIRAARCITTRQLVLQVAISIGSVCSMIEKCCSSMTMHGLTQAWEPGTHHQNGLDGAARSTLQPRSGTVGLPRLWVSRGTHFEGDNSVTEAVRKWLCRHFKTWFRQGIHALVARWRKTLQIDGDYVENSVCKRNIHLYCHQISTILNNYILRKNVGQNVLNNPRICNCWYSLVQFSLKVGWYMQRIGRCDLTFYKFAGMHNFSCWHVCWCILDEKLYVWVFMFLHIVSFAIFNVNEANNLS
jgi:hypothetical protein